MAQKKLNIKTGDTVVVISGKGSKEKVTGKVLSVDPKAERVVVEGHIDLKRHTKPSQANPQGGIIVKEAPMSSSKVMLVCPACKKATRIKKTELASGKFVRACKKCGEVVDKE